ncbi:MAG: hypothetical protein RLZZ306_196 [Bacteroidota bacterium]|jgi:short subunit dehydrogenase-like uncharacterized protein
MSFLIYGASGYTGKLIAELSVKKGLKPVLAGRTESKIKPLAKQFGLEYLIFGLDNSEEVVQNIANFPLVLNCAGPFSRTAKTLVQACLRSKTHYLDITGEIEVFEMIKTHDSEAKINGVILLPGVGFDVVPTDCMAKYLSLRLPHASHLELAFTSVGGSISHGTLTTMIESLGNSGFARENGIMVSKPTGYKGKMIDFGKLNQFAITIPWGDISTAYSTTGIPNIETYAGASEAAYNLMKLQSLFNPILQTKLVKNLLQKYVDNKITGPNENHFQNGKSLIWGKVTNAKGETVEAKIETLEGYRLTAEASVLITQKVLELKGISGYKTPAGLFGHELILEIEGSKFI